VAPAEEPIEIYYGTTKVTPTRLVTPAPAPEAGPVVPAAAKSGPHQDGIRRAEALVDTLQSVRDGTREISAAAVSVLGKVGDRVKHSAESRPIILASYSMPPIPQPQITVSMPPGSQNSQPPQVVVVREPAEARPAPSETPRALPMSIEMLVAGLVGMLGMLLAGMAWARGSRTVEAAPQTRPPVDTAQIHAIDPNSVQLMGKYNAGPIRETAEKFEIGPTYHEEYQQKKRVEESNNAAAVEFILNQNLALLAALNPEAEGEMVHTDAEGFAVPDDLAV